VLVILLRVEKTGGSVLDIIYICEHNISVVTNNKKTPTGKGCLENSLFAAFDMFFLTCCVT
jgi:hypothetical protein